jgi:hypothetical protein
VSWQTILKADGLVEKLDPKEKKKIKKLLQSAQPSEFMGQEITQLSDLLTAMTTRHFTIS